MSRRLDDWLEGFMFYTKESECPDNYLKWSGLHTLSAALQRQTYVPWVYHKFYPNIYVLLIGPPGVTHKNAAIRFSKNPLRAIDLSLASEAISKEALIQQMMVRALNEVNAITITASEFASFVRTSGPPMIEFLTDIFDCEDHWEYTTKGSGTQTIPAPYLTMFTGATPGWMATEFNRTFIDGGFASRTLIVYEVEPRFRKAFTEISDEMLDTYRDLVDDLAYITENISGEFRWTDSGTEWFRHWYEQQLPREEIDYRIAGYHGRKPTHLLKVAQLVCVNDGSVLNSSDLVLTEEILEKSLVLLEELEPGMGRAFKTFGDNPYSNDLERIAADIRESGKLKGSEIYAMNIHQIPKAEIDTILETLEQMELVKVTYRPGQSKLYEAIP